MFCNSACGPSRRYTRTANLHHTHLLTITPFSPLNSHLPDSPPACLPARQSACLQSCSRATRAMRCIHALACIHATLGAYLQPCTHTRSLACVYAVAQFLHAYVQPCMDTCNLLSTLPILHVHEPSLCSVADSGSNIRRSTCDEPSYT